MRRVRDGGTAGDGDGDVMGRALRRRLKQHMWRWTTDVYDGAGQVTLESTCCCWCCYYCYTSFVSAIECRHLCFLKS